jgi:hypothetical protein
MAETKKDAAWQGNRVHARQAMIFEMSQTIALRRVENRFGVTVREDANESIFDLLIRTGRAVDFDEAVTLLAKEFPSKERKPLSSLERLFMLLTCFRAKRYSHF